jgi:hypothetical protein
MTRSRTTSPPSPSNTDRKGHAMPTFPTPEPISVTLNLSAVMANIQVSAGDRVETTVDVRAADESSKSSRRVAEQTRVDYADGRLTITGPGRFPLPGRTGSVEVTIELPSGSRLQGETGMGALRSDGRLGDCRFKTAFGEIQLDHVGAAKLKSSHGSITVGHVDGGAEVASSNGAVHLRSVDGSATVRSSNGECSIGEVTGDLRVATANGSITVERAHADVTAKTPNGSIRVGEVTRGDVSIETAAGSVEIGIREGTAAWLDVKTIAGRVRNELGAVAGPEGNDGKVNVRARSAVGDIVVRRA